MINVMLVDDDRLFRSMFSSLIDWEQYGCALVRQAENGQQGIEYLNQGQIDLVFTDMNMPLVDGIQLIEYISEYMPHVKYVSLSSYDDFSYVKGSLTHGAIDYILKHMLTKDDLVRIINKYKSLSEKCPEKAIVGDNAVISAQAQSGFLVGLLEGAYASSEDLISLLKAVSLPDISKNVVLMYLDIADFESLKDKYLRLNKLPQLLQTIISIIQNIIDTTGMGTVFINECNHQIYILITSPGFSDEQFSKLSSRQLTGQIKKSLHEYLNLDASLIAAPVCAGIKDIHHAYLYILKQINASELNTNEPQDNEVQLPKSFMRELAHSLSLDSFEQTEKNIRYQFNDARKKNPQQSGLFNLAIQLLKCAAALDKQLKIHYFSNMNEQKEFLNEMMALTDFQAMQAKMLSLFQSIHDTLIEKEKSTYSPIVYKAIHLINRTVF